MRLSFEDERVLAVIAHPDDAELLCAGTLGRAAADGAPIGIAVLANGDKGQPPQALDNLGAVRRDEMAAAAGLLGADLFFAGFNDGELADTPEQRVALIDIYRAFRPTLVLAHHPGDYHADHRAAAALAEAASWNASSPGYLTEPPRLEAPPALWRMDTVNMLGFTPGFYIDVSRFVQLKRDMLAMHRSQMERAKDDAFMPLEVLMLKQCAARGLQAGVEAAEAFEIHPAWKRVGAF
ncbi:MAG: PIG-L deacetylase family protein [Planctomycetota bacterium]|jgi:LmbE family N-acetylglucosaminyl deacetylase